MADKLTHADIDRADVRELAEKLRAECKRGMSAGWSGVPTVQRFAASLLAVLDECDIRNVTHSNFDKAQTLHGVIRAAARAFWGT